MNTDDLNIELVERFLDGQISREEAIEKGNFSSEEAFEQLVEFCEAGIDDVIDNALSRDLKEIHSELFQEAPAKHRKFNWLAAAVILLVAIFGYLMLRPGQSTEPQFEAYFEPYPFYDLSRSNENSSFESAMELYAKKEFESAWSALNSLTDGSENRELLFYKGVCALVINKSEEAISSLQAYGKSADDTYEQQSKWYLALAFWQSGDIESAKEYLGAIVQGEFKFDKAQKLLSTL